MPPVFEAKQTRAYPPEFTVADGANLAEFKGPAAKERAEQYAELVTRAAQYEHEAAKAE